MNHLVKRPSGSVLATQLLLAALAAACQASVAPIPTATPEATATLVPEPSAWLLGYGDEGLALYDAATGERTDLALPPLWLPEADLQDIPGSGLVAARIASDRAEPDDLALAILRLPQGEILRRIPLFSDELVGWMQQARESGELDYILGDALGAVTGRWFRPHWSPDGASVAFAAMRDGDSADVYVYDVLQDEVRRLTDEPEQAVVLSWSPDGEWVLYSEAFGLDDDEYDYYPTMVRAASIRTGEVRELFEPISGLRIAVVGWLSTSQVVLVAVDAYYEELMDLVRVDLATGDVAPLYDGYFRWIDLDPQSGTLALTLEADPDLGDGMAIMRTGEAPSLITNPWQAGYWGAVRWLPQLGQFFAESDVGALAFTPAGAPAGTFENEGCPPVPSPDGRWLAFGPCAEGWFPQPGLRIYSATGQLLIELEQDYVEVAVWGPESESLYYLSIAADGPVLKWVEIPSGETRVVDRDARPSLALMQPAVFERQVVLSLPTEAPTPTPAPTLVPSPTPVRALDPDGPWLVGMTDQGPVAINPDGTGWTEFFAGAANGNSAGWLEAELSSTGRMAAIAAGSEGFPTSLVIGRPEMGVVRQLPIISPELAAEMDQLDENGQPKAWTQDVYLALDAEGWLDTLAWSPDGRTLAYVAAVDGPSADVYVYDTVADAVRRLTDGPNQPKLLGWSADSRWVLHLEITDINLGDGIWWDTLGPRSRSTGSTLIPGR